MLGREVYRKYVVLCSLMGSIIERKNCKFGIKWSSAMKVEKLQVWKKRLQRLELKANRRNNEMKILKTHKALNTWLKAKSLM